MEQPTPTAPSLSGAEAGLAYDLWQPRGEPPWPGVVVVHGAGSRKENHADFARLAAASGWTALTYDQRGHGASAGEMAPEAIADAGVMARRLGSVHGVDPGRVCVRGSSLGGFVAIHAASEPSIAAVIAICPAGEELLLEGIRRGRLEMAFDEDALVPWLQRNDIRDAARSLGAKPLILLHAEGDEQVPPSLSREIYDSAIEPKKLIVVPGGHHRSVQHDPELQGVALRWVERALEAG